MIEERVVIGFTDIAKMHHDIIIIKSSNSPSYAAHSRLYQGRAYGKTIGDACAQVAFSIDHNLPEAFHSKSAEKQQQMIAWCIEHLREGTQGKSKRYSTYYLKHLLEHCIGEYVGNGEMKGALMQAGFKPVKGTTKYDLNWEYLLQRGLGHLRGEICMSITREGFEKLTQSMPKINASQSLDAERQGRA